MARKFKNDFETGFLLAKRPSLANENFRKENERVVLKSRADLDNGFEFPNFRAG